MVVTLLQSEENHQSVTEYRLTLEVLNLTGSDDIHALAHADVAGERPAATNQKIPGFCRLSSIDFSSCREEQGLLLHDLP